MKDLATAIVESVRNQDRVIRYGGEEFLIFLSGADGRGAFQVAEKIRQRVESHPFLLPNGHPVASRVTVSIGVGARPWDGLRFRQIVEHADMRLYKAKEKGRNRTVGSDSGFTCSSPTA